MRANVLMFLWVCAVNIIDAVTTVEALSRGFSEGNPLAALTINFLGLFPAAVLKMFVVTVIAFIIMVIGDTKVTPVRVTSDICLLMLGLFFTYVSISNITYLL